MATLTPTIDQVRDVVHGLGLDEMLDAAVPPPTCEFQTEAMTEPCGASATWIMTLSCGHSRYYDDEHVTAVKSYIDGPGDNACTAKTSPHHRPWKRVTARFDRIAS